jgi:hypothetical protein
LLNPQSLIPNIWFFRMAVFGVSPSGAAGDGHKKTGASCLDGRLRCVVGEQTQIPRQASRVSASCSFSWQQRLGLALFGSTNGEKLQ